MALFKNTVTLRGFLGRDAEAPTSDGIKYDSYAVLTLCVDSGTWKKTTNEWVPQTVRHTIICPGPFFCGFTRGMKQGDYIEVEGELRVLEQNRTVVVVGKRSPGKHGIYAVHATQVRRLEHPSVGVDDGGDG